VKALKFINSPTIYIEIGQSSMKVLDGNDGLELSLERLENGRLTPLCAERLTASLRVFLKKHSWRSKVRAVCAIGARGVSLRRMTLPNAASDEELERLLALQIERDFPLSPDELAWGYSKFGRSASDNGTDVLVGAVKKDVIEQYAQLLSDAGLTPTFTLSALARGLLCSQASTFSILDVGRNHSELISFRDGTPENIRVFAWGGENVTAAIEKKLGVSHADAEKAKLSRTEPTTNGEAKQNISSLIAHEIDGFAKSIPANALGDRVYLTGGGTRLDDFASRLVNAVGNGTRCERLETVDGEGRSAAIVGLCLFDAKAGRIAPLILRPRSLAEQSKTAAPGALRWALLGLALLVACVSVRYAEAIIKKPQLTRRLAEVKTYRDSLPRIERELLLFEYLRTNQPAYIEPLFALAGTVPPGTRIDSINMNKRGDLSLRATMKDPQQIVQMRSKLIESGLFTSVVVEEQTPSSDRQKLSVRMSGQWKTTGSMPDPPLTSTNKTSSAARKTATNAPPNTSPK